MVLLWWSIQDLWCCYRVTWFCNSWGSVGVGAMMRWCFQRWLWRCWKRQVSVCPIPLLGDPFHILLEHVSLMSDQFQLGLEQSDVALLIIKFFAAHRWQRGRRIYTRIGWKLWVWCVIKLVQAIILCQFFVHHWIIYNVMLNNIYSHRGLWWRTQVKQSCRTIQAIAFCGSYHK